jgi:hypothetical protein
VATSRSRDACRAWVRATARAATLTWLARLSSSERSAALNGSPGSRACTASRPMDSPANGRSSSSRAPSTCCPQAGQLLPADLDGHAAQPQCLPHRADHGGQHLLGRGGGIQTHAQQAECRHRIVPQPEDEPVDPALSSPATWNSEPRTRLSGPITRAAAPKRRDVARTLITNSSEVTDVN